MTSSDCHSPTLWYRAFVFDPLLVRIDMDVNEQERLFKIEI
jgi:hypothetical protein